MKNILHSLVLLSLILVVFTQTFSASCPRGLSPLELYSDSFEVSSATTSAVKLNHGVDSHCFNYTLPSAFKGNLEIALAINEFQSSRGHDLFFSVRPLLTWQYNTVPFQVRTPWKYTKWIKLTINFLLESRTDIQSGYYQRDTGLVSACGTAKVQPVYLPFTTKWNVQSKNLTVRVFLIGFEISTQPTNPGRSPYELQLINTVYNQTGIIVQLSTTTSTQVNTVYISYIVFDQSKVGITLVTGTIELDVVNGGMSSLIRQNTITSFKNYIYGLSGFSVNQNFAPHIQTTIDQGFTFTLNLFNSTFNFVGFNYVIFSYNPCTTCQGYPLLSVGVCVKQCPAQSITVGYNCFPCPVNSVNNNGVCVCNEGYYNISGACTSCPLGQIWNGNECIGCAAHAIWVGNLCQCEQGYYNLSGICQNCPTGSHWNGNTCIGCGINAYWFAGACQCNPGFYNISGFCQKCPSGTIFNGRICTIPCKPNEVWTGRKCQSLCQKVRNSFWNGIQCICNQGFINVNGLCIRSNFGDNDDFDHHDNDHHDNFNDPDDHHDDHHDEHHDQNNQNPNNPPNTCNKGNYYNTQSAKCLPCLQGCSQCKNAQTCDKCSTGFISSAGRSCKQVCGDGRRFISQCDDGNSIDGDGCSSSCIIEPGFSCKYGSPTSKDICTPYVPSKTTIVVTGQSITGANTISFNVRLNWAPPGLLSDAACTHCTDMITARVTDTTATPTIKVNYVKGTSYTFTITVDFGTAPLNKFTLISQINPSLRTPDFAGCDISQVLRTQVNPSNLAHTTKLSGA